jgi:hypothetical protein
MYIPPRMRVVTPRSPAMANKPDAESNVVTLYGLFTPEATGVFYEAMTTQSSVRSTAYSLQEKCQIHALAQFFGVSIIFTTKNRRF